MCFIPLHPKPSLCGYYPVYATGCEKSSALLPGSSPFLWSQGALGGSGMYLLFPVNCCFQPSITGIILQHNSSTSLGCGSRQNSTLLSPNKFYKEHFSVKGINHTRYMRSQNMKCLASKCRGTIKSGFLAAWITLCWNSARGVWSQNFVGNSLTGPSLLKNAGLGPVFSLKHLGLTAFFQAQGRNSSNIFITMPLW